jgi:hypothetical protein
MLALHQQQIHLGATIQIHVIYHCVYHRVQIHVTSSRSTSTEHHAIDLHHAAFWTEDTPLSTALLMDINALYTETQSWGVAQNTRETNLETNLMQGWTWIGEMRSGTSLDWRGHRASCKRYTAKCMMRLDRTRRARKLAKDCARMMRMTTRSSLSVHATLQHHAITANTCTCFCLDSSACVTMRPTQSMRLWHRMSCALTLLQHNPSFYDLCNSFECRRVYDTT